MKIYKITKPFFTFLIAAIVSQSCKNESQIEILSSKTKKNTSNSKKQNGLCTAGKTYRLNQIIGEIWTQKKRQYHAAKSFVTVGKMTKGNEKEVVFENPKMIFRQKSATPKLQMTALWLRFPKFKTEKRKANYFQ